MIGQRSAQAGLFDAGNVFGIDLDPDTFYGQLAQVSRSLFSDEQFAGFYSDRNGRPSVPPSLLALTLLMQEYAGVSDLEAVERTGVDLRWAVVLGRPAGEPLCAKSTLQMFRAHLVLHEQAHAIFAASIEAARAAGLLGKKVRVAVDTKPIVGRGSVEDTYNLLARGIRQAAGALASQARTKKEKFLRRHGLERYAAPSIKGAEVLDWSDEAAVRGFLSGVVADAAKVLSLCGQSGDATVKKQAALLEQLLLQDVEVIDTPQGPAAGLVQGTAPGRVPSATDPEQRHGRKSKSKRFTGHKASVATDVDSGIILAVDVLAGDAADATGVLGLVESAEANSGGEVIETLGDCAYGSGATRQEFAEAGRTLLAKAPPVSGPKGLFNKSEFVINLDTATVTCPGGAMTSTFRREADGTRVFSFGAACAGCALRSLCTSSAGGRTIAVHAQEALLQEARVCQASAHGRARLKDRLVVENSLARLSWLGISQARYVGHLKTRYQLTMSAAVANLRRTWRWRAQQGPPIGQLRPVAA